MQRYVSFQSTLPQGERPEPANFTARNRRISIHAPTRGATGFESYLSNNTENFNPRSHKGSDRIPKDITDKLSPISIHAPTRGATKGSECYLINGQISIHAPTRGATGSQDRFYCPTCAFQSTLPQGERPGHLDSVQR